MAAKKKTELKVAPSPTSKEEAKSATPKRIEAGDWFMPDDPIFVQMHRATASRSKEKVLTFCRLELRPDFSGRKLGKRCSRCVERSADFDKAKKA